MKPLKTQWNSKSVIVWEVRTGYTGNVVPMRKQPREALVEAETTTTEWTVGSENGEQESTTKVTMVSSGFGETVRKSSETASMRLAA